MVVEERHTEIKTKKWVWRKRHNKGAKERERERERERRRRRRERRRENERERQSQILISSLTKRERLLGERLVSPRVLQDHGIPSFRIIISPIRR